MSNDEIKNWGIWTLEQYSSELPQKWRDFPSDEQIKNTMKALNERNIEVTLVDDRKEALQKLKEMIPKGVSVMTGSSTTLYQIGFMDYYIKEENPWNCLGLEIFEVEDQEKKVDLQRKAETADFFIASTNAIAETGKLVAADASGSRVSAFPYSAKNLILVAGIQKITRDLESAMERIRQYVYPLEDQRARKAYGVPSNIGKWVIIEYEQIDKRIQLILVKEELGF